MVYYPANTQTKTAQTTQTSADVYQSQIQGIYIKDSSAITITQQEIQVLIIVQLALQAALDAVIIAFDLNTADDDIVELQKMIESVKAAQIEHQRIMIKDSYNVTVNQEQAQIDILIQAAIALLARIKIKYIEF